MPHLCTLRARIALLLSAQPALTAACCRLVIIKVWIGLPDEIEIEKGVPAAKTTSWPWQKAPGKTEKKNGFARWWSMCFPEPSKAAPSLPKPTPKRAQELVKKKSAEKAA